jgi:hypothetical protein
MCEALVLGTGVAALRRLPRLLHCTNARQPAARLGKTRSRQRFPRNPWNPVNPMKWRQKYRRP